MWDRFKAKLSVITLVIAALVICVVAPSLAMGQMTNGYSSPYGYSPPTYSPRLPTDSDFYKEIAAQQQRDYEHARSFQGSRHSLAGRPTLPPFPGSLFIYPTQEFQLQADRNAILSALGLGQGCASWSLDGC